MPAQVVTVTTTDDDVAGFTLSKSTATVSESGNQDTFTVVLTAPPDTNVVMAVTSGDVGEATVSPATVTFSPSDWNIPQTITVTGANDWLIDGDQTTQVTLDVVDALSDDHFDSLAEQTVAVTTTDDDTAGVTLSKTAANVSEAGSVDTFAIALTAQPNSNVVVAIVSGDSGEAAVSPAALTFTPADWNTPQTVTVTGVNDWLIDGSQTTLVTLSVVDGASDDNFDAVADQTVSVTTTDNDSAGLMLDRTAVSVSESGTTATFTVALTAQPDTNVMLAVSSGDVDEAVVSPVVLTFTPSAWNTPKTVTVTGVNDWLIDGSQLTLVTIRVVDASSDDKFDAVADQSLVATTTDDDLAGFRSSKTVSVVSESGSQDTFTVVLTAQPDSDVVLTVTSGDTGEAAVSPAAVTFTPANWNLARIVTVSGVDDWLLDGNQITLVTVSVDDAASDDAFDNAADQVVFVTTADNDVAGFTLSRSTAGVSEAGSTDSFTVALTAQPHSDVVLSVTSSDTTEVTVSPATLTFTPATWNTPQTVTVQGVDDPLIDGTPVHGGDGERGRCVLGRPVRCGGGPVGPRDDDGRRWGGFYGQQDHGNGLRGRFDGYVCRRADGAAHHERRADGDQR